MIHFPADISQAATIKNYKLNFGSDLHIYLFVQVLLGAKAVNLWDENQINKHLDTEALLASNLQCVLVHTVFILEKKTF